jgi:hypothetical protein
MPIPAARTLAIGGGLGALSYYYLSQNNKIASVNTETRIPASVTSNKKQNYTLLEPQEIDNRLLSGQFSNKLPFNHIKATYTNQLPSNDPVEDNFSINTFQNGLIAGVYDGKRHCAFFLHASLIS